MFTTQMLTGVVQQAFAMLPDHPFAVRLWDGTTIAPPGKEPRFTLAINDGDVLDKAIAAPGWSALGEAYLGGDIDIEGDILAAYPLAELLQGMFGADNPGQAPADLSDVRLAAADATHTQERDKEAIAHHYDQGNRMFELITDEGTMGYSCAAFYSDDDSLEQAQKNKLERAAGKVDVKPGDRVLDIGCGWGGLLEYVAGDLGATAVGVTIAEEQLRHCEALMERKGLADRVSVHLCDYRDIDESEPFDKIISLGMVEHVGPANLGIYFKKAFDLLKPGGLMLLQGLSSRITEERAEVIDFASDYLFPDASMPYFVDYAQAMQEAGFEIRDVENLREHYGWTHERWLRNLEANKDAVVAEFGEKRFRAMRIMFSYSNRYLLAGTVNLFQWVLWKPDGSERPNLPYRRKY